MEVCGVLCFSVDCAMCCGICDTLHKVYLCAFTGYNRRFDNLDCGFSFLGWV